MKIFRITVLLVALLASFVAIFELVQIMTTAHTVEQMKIISRAFINFVVAMILCVAGWVGFYSLHFKLKNH